MFVKIERDECHVYFVAPDDPRMAARWGVELSLAELKDFKDCELKFFKWQSELEIRIQKGAELSKSDSKRRK